MTSITAETTDLMQEQEALIKMTDQCEQMRNNLNWLKQNMHPYFFGTLQHEQDALATLAYGLTGMKDNRRMILADRDNTLILACLSQPGSLYETLQIAADKPISLAEFTDSKAALPGTDHYLEIHKYQFERKKHGEIDLSQRPRIPAEVKKRVTDALERYYPEFDHRQKERLLKILWLNNKDYILDSSPRRVAKLLWLYQQTVVHDGIFVDLEFPDPAEELGRESRLFFWCRQPAGK